MSINKKSDITNRNINNKTNPKIDGDKISRESLENIKIEDLNRITNKKDKKDKKDKNK